MGYQYSNLNCVIPAVVAQWHGAAPCIRIEVVDGHEDTIDAILAEGCDRKTVIMMQ